MASPFDIFAPFDAFQDPFNVLAPPADPSMTFNGRMPGSVALSGGIFGGGPPTLTAAELLDPDSGNPSTLSAPEGGFGKLPGPQAPVPGFQTTVTPAESAPTGIGFGGQPVESPFSARAPAPVQGGLMDFIRRHEGFRATPYSDFQQTSIGFGTRARPGETQITREEAERRLQEEVGNAHTMVRAFAPNLTQGQLDALTDLTFNAGPGWMQSGLGQAVRAGDWPRARELFLQYINAGGQPHAGLRGRRAELADQLLSGTGLGGQPGLTAADYQPGADFQQLGDPRAGINAMTVQPGVGAINAMAGQPTGVSQAPQAPQVPPFSPTATALVPGLGRAPVGPQAGVARMGFAGIGDVLGLSGRSAGQPMTSPADFFGHLPLRQQEAATEVFVRGQELRLQNPGASPDQLMQLLIRDPVFGRNALSLGANPVAVVQAAINPTPPAPGGFTLNPGDRRFDAAYRLIAEAPPRVPDQAALVQWLQGLTPEQRTEAIATLQAMRPVERPSDREQAIARIRQTRALGLPDDVHDLQIAGYIQPLTRVNQFGQTEVTGYQNILTGEPVANLQPRTVIAGTGAGQVPQPGQPGVVAPTQPVGPPPPMGGVGANAPLAGADGTPTGFTFSQEPWQPGMPVTPELRQLFEAGAFQPGAGNLNLFRPPTVGGQPITSSSQAGPGRATEVQAPAPVDTALRRFRLGDREFNDVPGISFRSSQLADPAEMFLSVGAGPLARQFLARIAGQVPSLSQTEEAATARAAALDNLRAVLASYQEGARQLRGEHETAMATIPSSGEILSSPTRAFQQAITLRERIVADYQLALGQARDLSLPQSARTAAAERASRAQAVLLAMPTMEQLFNYQDIVRRGQATGTTLPGLSEVTKLGQETVSAVTGTDQPKAAEVPVGPARIPEDLTDATRFPSSRLLEIARQPGVSVEDLRRIADEVRRRSAVGQ